MTGQITWYDVLGVTPGATGVTLQRAHDERLLQLRRDLLADAPPPVVSVASRATEAVETAWLVLGDRERRRTYDAQLGRRRLRTRRLSVPDVRGLFYRPGQAVAVMAGLRLAVVRLTADPLPVEGLIVGQSPAPGDIVRSRSTLTVQVWHPAKSRLLTGDGAA